LFAGKMAAAIDPLNPPYDCYPCLRTVFTFLPDLYIQGARRRDEGCAGTQLQGGVGEARTQAGLGRGRVAVGAVIAVLAEGIGVSGGHRASGFAGPDAVGVGGAGKGDLSLFGALAGDAIARSGEGIGEGDL